MKEKEKKLSIDFLKKKISHYKCVFVRIIHVCMIIINETITVNNKINN